MTPLEAGLVLMLTILAIVWWHVEDLRRRLRHVEDRCASLMDHALPRL
jgi:hypothetical protein